MGRGIGYYWKASSIKRQPKAGSIGQKMKRRDFITLVGGAAVGLPRAVYSQPIPVIGMLLTGSRASSAPFLDEFHVGLGELGYVEGRNVAVEYRWAGDRHERFRELAE
jgi:putative tryptophan/tyrosine transport system substrate-binding protein